MSQATNRRFGLDFWPFNLELRSPVASGPRNSICLGFLDAREVDGTGSHYGTSTCIKQAAPRNAAVLKPVYGDAIRLLVSSLAWLQFPYEHVRTPLRGERNRE